MSPTRLASKYAKGNFIKCSNNLAPNITSILLVVFVNTYVFAMPKINSNMEIIRSPIARTFNVLKPLCTKTLSALQLESLWAKISPISEI